jgi:hypothetical protein
MVANLSQKSFADQLVLQMITDLHPIRSDFLRLNGFAQSLSCPINGILWETRQTVLWFEI